MTVSQKLEEEIRGMTNEHLMREIGLFSALYNKKEEEKTALDDGVVEILLEEYRKRKGVL